MRVINGRFPFVAPRIKGERGGNGFSFAARVASLVLFLLFMVFAHEGRTQPGHTVRFINGYWFNGTSFDKKTIARSAAIRYLLSPVSLPRVASKSADVAVSALKSRNSVRGRREAGSYHEGITPLSC